MAKKQKKGAKRSKKKAKTSLKAKVKKASRKLKIRKKRIQQKLATAKTEIKAGFKDVKTQVKEAVWGIGETASRVKESGIQPLVTELEDTAQEIVHETRGIAAAGADTVTEKLETLTKE